MKKNIVLAAVAALIFLAAGYFIGSANLGKGANTYQAGWDAAKKRLVDSGFIAPMGNFEVKNVSGQVAAVNGNAVTLKIKPMEPLADPDLDERIINVGKDSKIYILEQKDQAQYQSEMADYNKKLQERMKVPPMAGKLPEMFVKKEAGLGDIKAGAVIDVTAADKDIKNAKQFTAAEIDIRPAPAAVIPGVPAAPAPVAPEVKK